MSVENNKKVGLDFDNTILNYDGVFYEVALQRKWVRDDNIGTKLSVRNEMRSQGMEENWIELQGLVYGKYISQADLFPGVIDFINLASAKGFTCEIISHRTKYPYKGERYNLHLAAQNFIDAFLVPKIHCDLKTSFHETKERKLVEIKNSKCNFFVDDLPEILEHQLFPNNCYKILFDPNKKYCAKSKLSVVSDWHEISSLLIK